jgi:mRNA export factor
MQAHNGPVLCADFSGDGQTVFSGSCDNTVKAWSLASNQTQTIAQHQAPVKSVFCVNEMNAVVTGSWDKTMKYWDIRAPKEQSSVALPERVYAMDVRYPLAVVGTAERHLLIYDLRKHQQPFRTLVSPLKMQTRCVATFMNSTGFAVGSIEGRVAIQHIDDKEASKNFAFKCHRINQEVYAVNNIAFHKYGTFATAGSDGIYTFWDKDSKQRLKIFQRNTNPITCAAFHKDGLIYAYAVSYDWSKGHEHHDKSKPNKIYLHPVTDAEIKPK